MDEMEKIDNIDKNIELKVEEVQNKKEEKRYLKFKKTNTALKLIMILLIILLIILLCNYLIKSKNKNKENKKNESKTQSEQINTDKKVEEGLTVEELRAKMKEETDYEFKVLNSEEEYNDVIKQDKTVILYSMVGCPPCIEQKNIFASILEKNPNINLYVLEILDGAFVNVVDAEKIESTPTIKIYKNGKNTFKVEGTISEEEFLAEYNK